MFVAETRVACFPSNAVCNPDVLAIESAASAIDVAFPTDVTTPVRLALVVTFPAVSPEAVPVRLVAVIDDGVPPAQLNKTGAPALPTLIARAVHTPVQSPVIEPTAGVIVVLPAAVTSHFALTVKVPAAVALPKEPTFELTVARVVALVLLAVPSKEEPAVVTSPVRVPIVLAFCRAVAVQALPDTLVWSPVFVPLVLANRVISVSVVNLLVAVSVMSSVSSVVLLK